MTTGILVFSGGTPVTIEDRLQPHLQQQGRDLAQQGRLSASGLCTNTFANVTTPILSGR